MSLSKLRPSIAVICSAMVLALPAEANACWLFSCFHPAPAACPAPACPAPMATQVNYVPQTCYRTVYSPVAVTSYRPVTTADPCTGCPVTSLSPVTTYVQRPVVVPYTTYRPVITTVQLPVAPACPCSPCATGACGAAPATTYYAPAAIAAPAPSCGCGATAATAAYYAPTALAYGGTTTSYYPTTFGGSTYSATANYNAPISRTTVAPSASTVAPAFTGAAPATSYYAPADSSVIAPPASSITGSTIISSSPSSTTTIMSSPGSPSTAGTITTGTPTNTYYNGVPMPGPVNFNSSLGNGTSAGAATAPPVLPPANNGFTPPQKPTEANPPPEVPPMKPIPNSDSTNKGNSTGIFKSEPDGRTTAMPVVRPWAYTALYRPHVSLVSAKTNKAAEATATSATPAATASAANPVIVDVDADAWHAAR